MLWHRTFNKSSFICAVSVLASYKVGKLCLYHAERAFSIRPQMIMLHELLSIEDKVVIHLVPYPSAARLPCYHYCTYDYKETRLEFCHYYHI